MNLRVVHVVADAFYSPVITSQNVLPLQLLGKAAPDIARGILFLASFRDRRNAAVRSPQREAVQHATGKGVNVSFAFRVPANVPLSALLWAGAIRRYLVRQPPRPGEITILHCRGAAAAAAAVRIKRNNPAVRVMLDLRGLRSDEITLAGIRGWYFRTLDRHALQAALRGVDALNTVSHGMQNELQKTGNLRPTLPRVVIGGCTDTRRFFFDPEIRRRRRCEMGLEGKFVLCYSGSLSWWQRPDAIAEAFSAVRREMPDAHLLVLSRDFDLLRTELRRRGMEDATTTALSVAHDEVPSCLAAADIGLLLRENRPTNRVAAPTKFAEYLRAGLPVILTPYVGDFSSLSEREGLGETVPFPFTPGQVINAVRSLRVRLESEKDAYRKKISQHAGDRLSWQGRLPALISLYRQIAET